MLSQPSASFGILAQRLSGQLPASRMPDRIELRYRKKPAPLTRSPLQYMFFSTSVGLVRH